MERQPATVADAVADAVTAGKFWVSILEFDFNPEILLRKPFGLRKNGQTNFGKPFLPEKIPAKTIWPCNRGRIVAQP